MSDIDGQSGAEALDGAQLGADEATLGDETSLDYPPDGPLGVDEAQVADDAIADSIEERLAARSRTPSRSRRKTSVRCWPRTGTATP